MENLADILTNILSRSETAKPYFERALREYEELTPKEFEERRAERYNRSTGNINDDGVYDCKACMNRGDFAEVEERNGSYYMTLTPCKCMTIRQSIWRMKASGLEASIRQCTFDRFEVKTDWQRKMLDTAKDYLATGSQNGAWLFMGGAIGAGKTHICTAVCRDFLYAGRRVYYMPWQGDSTKLKAMVNDEEEYSRLLWRLKDVEVLYIDDFFKPVMGDNGPLPPTTADVKLAYDILNHRYINRALTIISSERYLSELMDIDEATASRIYERSKGYAISLKREREKNHRLSDDDPI